MTPEKKKLGLNADSTNPGDPADAEKFSEIVYKRGGPFRDRGRPYSYRGVTSEEDYERLLSDGWSKTKAEAFAVPTEDKTPYEVQAATDEEIYNMAKEGFSWKEITKKTGNKAPHLSAKRYAESNSLPYPPVAE